MELTQTELIVGLAIIAAIVYKFLYVKKDEEGRIKDSSVTVNRVLEALDEFSYKMEKRLQAGYTEKSIQNQLKKHLQKTFVHIIDEYGVEGANATKIDFDIGNGMVGLELKIAKSIFKTSNLHRLAGQMEDYIDNKYDEDNLIVAVFGEKSHTAERAMLKKVSDKVEEKGAEYVYIEI